MRLGILLCVLAAGAGGAQAAHGQGLGGQDFGGQDTGGQDTGGHNGGEWPPLPVIDCYCTDGSGVRVDLGETICLLVDGRAFLARCEMSLNNPMWRDQGADCLGAELSPGAKMEPRAPGGA